jgi:hypothetical protein
VGEATERPEACNRSISRGEHDVNSATGTPARSNPLTFGAFQLARRPP